MGKLPAIYCGNRIPGRWPKHDVAIPHCAIVHKFTHHAVNRGGIIIVKAAELGQNDGDFIRHGKQGRYTAGQVTTIQYSAAEIDGTGLDPLSVLLDYKSQAVLV